MLRGGGGLKICAFAAGGNWLCEADRGGAATQGATMHAIYDAGGVFCIAGKYCAFGTDAFGTDFCCNADPGNLNSVQLSGADYDDELYFSYTSGGTTVELRDSPSRAIVGFQYGQAGDDQLFGSSSTRVNYDESLHGGDDADLVYGYDGGDSLYGDAGPDVCDGGAGIDYVDGGADDDTLRGGAQNDELAASDGNDELNGNIGADILYGDLMADLYCGGADTVYDQLLEDPAVGSDDRLWGSGSADYEQAALPGAGGDGCSLNGTTDGNCDYTLSPPTCP